MPVQSGSEADQAAFVGAVAERRRTRSLACGASGAASVRVAGSKSSIAHAPGCSYCNILRKWEKREFREAGAKWIAEYAEEQCRVPTGGGGKPGGGTRHAH